MVDFTNCSINHFRCYGGKNGSKICIIYNDNNYMLKFPSKNNKSFNSSIIEYISTKIIKSLGFDVQDTILGTYKVNGKEKVVVLCRDFETNDTCLKPFVCVKNTQIDLKGNGYTTELSEILETIDNQTIYSKKKLKDFFWKLFIADSLIGNTGRDNTNWGFLINEKTGQVNLSPVYGNSSSLYFNLTDEEMFKYLNDKVILELQLYNLNNSVLKIDGKNIKYYDFISSLENEDLNKALLEIFPKINLNKIYKIIDSVDVISDIRKKFYKKIIKMRYEKILNFSYDKLMNNKK